MEEEDIGEATQLSQSGSVMAYKRARKTTWRSNKRHKPALSKAGGNGPGRVNFGRLKRNVNSAITQITRGVDYGLASQSTGTDIFGGQVFKLSDLPNYTQLTAAYDEFRIKAVKVYMCPIFVANTSASGQLTAPTLITALDYDDAGTPANTAAILQFDSHRIHGPFTKQYTRIIKPQVSIAAYSGTFVAYAQREDQWIDCNSPGASHYAFKWGVIDANNNAGTWSWALRATFYLEFRHAL